MKKIGFILTCIFLLLLQNAAFANVETEWYCNERFDVCVQYPVNLIPNGESQNGDGQSFSSEDGEVTYLVYGRNYQPEFDEGFEQFITYEMENSAVSYQRVKDNFCILSGYTYEGKIFYQKVKFIDDLQSQYLVIRIEYPSHEKGTYDAFCKVIANM